MTERSEEDAADQEEGPTQDASADPDGETDTWQFDPDFRWGGEDGGEIRFRDREVTWRDRLPDSSSFRGVSGMFRKIDPTTVVPSLLKGTVRFVWPLAVGLGVVAALDQVDPRRQVEYSRLITEMPLTVAIGIGALGVAVRAVSGGVPDWPSAGAVIRTTVLLALLVGLFALLGPTGVV